MLLIMYQIFSSLLGHLPFSVQFFLHSYGVTFFGTPNIAQKCPSLRFERIYHYITVISRGNEKKNKSRVQTTAAF